MRFKRKEKDAAYWPLPASAQRLRPFPLRRVPSLPRLRYAPKVEDFATPRQALATKIEPLRRLRRFNLPKIPTLASEIRRSLVILAMMGAQKREVWNFFERMCYKYGIAFITLLMHRTSHELE